MNILSLLTFIFICSIDNLIVAIAYGLKNIKVNLSANLIIGFVSALGTFISMKFGNLLLYIIPNKIASLIGSLILISIGVWFIFDWIKKDNNIPKIESYNLIDCPERADQDYSGYIDLKESFSLSLALTINNFALGIGGSISGLNLWTTSIFILLFSIFLIPLGIFIGSKISYTKIGNKSSLLSGLLLIILAIFQLL